MPTSTPNARLPQTQGFPQPAIGSHWTRLFESIVARREARRSYLNDAYADPEAWCRQTREYVLTHLHYDPPPCDPNPEVIDREDQGTYVREKVVISTTPDIRFAVYALIPKGLDKPAPGIVNLHDHSNFYLWGKEKLVELKGEHPELTAFRRKAYGGRGTADALAKRGYVVIVPDLLHWGERALYLANDPERIRKRTLQMTAEDIKRFDERSWGHEELLMRTALTCGTTWAGINVWDDIRVTDYLISRQEVDPRRIGCVGHSMGGMRSVLLGAFHPAVRASVSACYAADYRLLVKCWVALAVGFADLVPGIYADIDWADLLGLHWPGAVLSMQNTNDATFDSISAGLDKAKRIFTKMGCPEKYESRFVEGGHRFDIDMQETVFAWLDRQLQS